MMKRLTAIAASAVILLVAFGCGEKTDPALDSAAAGAKPSATPANSPKAGAPAGKSSSPINPADLTK